MKRAFGFSRKFLVVASTMFMSAAVITGCDKDEDDTTTSNMYTLSGAASGSQMVPAVTTSGSGTITGTYNASTNMMTYTTNWANLSGAPTSGGFYTGASGSAGVAAGSSWTMGTGLSGTGSFSGTMVLTDDQETQLRNGNWYYSLGTASNTGGEIRGQITTTLVP